MNYFKTVTTLFTLTIILFSCQNGDDIADGYGNFEATEITVSAENNGKLMQLYGTKKGSAFTCKPLVVSNSLYLLQAYNLINLAE